MLRSIKYLLYFTISSTYMYKYPSSKKHNKLLIKANIQFIYKNITNYQNLPIHVSNTKTTETHTFIQTKDRQNIEQPTQLCSYWHFQWVLP